MSGHINRDIASLDICQAKYRVCQTIMRYGLIRGDYNNLISDIFRSILLNVRLFNVNSLIKFIECMTKLSDNMVCPLMFDQIRDTLGFLL